MTKYLTLPSLAIAVFFTNYHNSDHQIKMVKGIVEKDIRSAYKGGIVNNYNTQLVTNANYYDMNSQYPSAMLLDMPVGNPVFTTNKNLNDIFAFVYGLITPPVKEVLPNLIIETTVNGEIVFSPKGRKPFYRWINSEQIKLGIKHGYKFEMMCGYKFSRGKDVFKAFVEELFNIKRFSTNEVERNSAKLMLNSVYGRFGMKEIISQIKVIKAKDYNEKMNKKMNHVVLTELANGDKLVKYSGKIDERLRKLIKYLEDESYKELKENKPMMN
jgi:hypothetical protein